MYTYMQTKGSQSTSARAQASPSITSRTSCCHTACEHQTSSGSLETQSLSRLLQVTFPHHGPLSPGRSSLKGHFSFTPQRSHIQRLLAALLLISLSMWWLLVRDPSCCTSQPSRARPLASISQHQSSQAACLAGGWSLSAPLTLPWGRGDRFLPLLCLLLSSQSCLAPYSSSLTNRVELCFCCFSASAASPRR